MNLITPPIAHALEKIVSPLRSGLLTIGPRFGGALDDKATMLAEAQSTGVKPKDFVDNMRRSNKVVMGSGHPIGFLENPDQRVVIIKEYAKVNFFRVGPVTQGCGQT